MHRSFLRFLFPNNILTEERSDGTITALFTQNFMEDITINRAVSEDTTTVDKVFTGLENVTALIEEFGDALPDVLASTEVKLFSDPDLYMYIDDEGGSIVIGRQHLEKSEDRVLYLDIVHEFVHIKQLREGQELFDEKHEYIDRPTEIEAYTKTVQEAKRIGMSTGEILDYLYVEWITNEDVLRLAKNCGLEV